MNLLYLCHRIPYPPNKGDKIRSFHQVEHLSRRHAVHVACLVDRKGDLAYVEPLRAYCASLDAVYLGPLGPRLAAIGALAGTRPLSVAAFHSKALHARIRRRIREGSIDAAIAFSASMAEYVLDQPALPKVLDLVDVDSEKWRSYAGRHRFPLSRLFQLEADRLARYEAHASRAFDESLLITHAEADLFRRRGGGSPMTVIANGVDSEYFHPPEGGARGATPMLVFVGAMDYFPNADAVAYFCDQILPRVLTVVPETRLVIVGREPTREVRRLGGRPHVEVTGSVPDVRPYLDRAWISVAPFRVARGIQNKILEAMAAGLPVVGTSIAFQGIAADERDGVHIADEPGRLAAMLIALLSGPELRNRCGGAARRYVERHHRWEDHGRALEAALARAVSRARDRRRSGAEPRTPTAARPVNR